SNPSTNIQSTSAPPTHTNVHAEENNNDQAEEGEQLQDDEFTNPLYAPAQEEVESSTHNIVQTQRQLATDPEMCMYVLTVSTAEPKNIKEAMADSAWIEAMKKYILVIVDDYSRYTWTLFLRSKDETPKVLKDFLMMIQRNLQASVITVRTERGTEFLNKTLNAFFKEEGIEHQTSTARIPE
nr:integrase, catalytic region, zinc finger, CCHC-type, peptidase aspartic, catalytic [Tanacetum cinerariifolium]